MSPHSNICWTSATDTKHNNLFIIIIKLFCVLWRELRYTQCNIHTHTRTRTQRPKEYSSRCRWNNQVLSAIVFPFHLCHFLICSRDSKQIIIIIRWFLEAKWWLQCIWRNGMKCYSSIYVFGFLIAENLIDEMVQTELRH